MQESKKESVDATEAGEYWRSIGHTETQAGVHYGHRPTRMLVQDFFDAFSQLLNYWRLIL